MGRAGGAAGLPVLTVALDDCGNLLSRDPVQVQVQPAGLLDRAPLRL
jgi:hypothetical protein